MRTCLNRGIVYPETSGIVDGTLQSDAGDEDAVGSIDAVPLAYVQAQCLTRPFDDLHKMYRVLRILLHKREREMIYHRVSIRFTVKKKMIKHTYVNHILYSKTDQSHR